MQKWIILFSIILAFCFACDSGGGSGDSLNKGEFLDSAVEGLNFKTDTQEGVTNKNGRFYYKDNETVNFYLGDIHLGSTVGKETVTPIDLVPEATNEDHPEVLRICRLLISLDEDGEPENGITLTPTVVSEFEGRNINLSLSLDDNPFIQDVFVTLNALDAFSDGNHDLVSSTFARSHFAATLQAIQDKEEDDRDEGDGSVDGGGSDEGGGDLNSLGMEFVYIEPGSFIMGSPEDEPGRSRNEIQHQVTLTQGFYIQTTEVTQGQWQAVMGSNPADFSACGDDCPVEFVSWNDVQAFIDALNSMGEGTYRLPTEAEWEYVARAGSTTAFANGQITETGTGYDPVLDSMGWYAYNSNGSTHPVAQKQANAWGLYDMHGNVYEWCQDRYGSYPSESVTDPEGPSSITIRVYRGGSWLRTARRCRSAFRSNDRPGFANRDLGFRLVRAPSQ